MVVWHSGDDVICLFQRMDVGSKSVIFALALSHAYILTRKDIALEAVRWT